MKTSGSVEKNTDPLPSGWSLAKLGDCSEINPRRPTGFDRAPDAPTTFVPMPAVDAVRGVIADRQIRPFAEVAKGYTYFAEGDVLFAKITPCMQNGKHAIATGLVDGVGFASTEFHVIRPGPDLDARWVHALLRQPSILQEATNHFTGAVGQQRVPEEFLDNLLIPVAPLSEQQRIAAALNTRLDAVNRAQVAAFVRTEAAVSLLPLYLHAIFEKSASASWKQDKLGDVLGMRREVIHPREKPRGIAVFVGLEHIESATGVRTGCRKICKEELTGRKPQFCKGDIVYGYLRPYLNKVWVAEFDGLCSVDQYVFVVNKEKANPDFVAWFMRSPVYLKRAPITLTPGQLPRIRTEEVLATAINLPDLNQQEAIIKQIAAKADQVLRLQETMQLQCLAINALPAVLLRSAFSGAL
jgi:type I restriction enzyme S subunit